MMIGDRFGLIMLALMVSLTGVRFAAADDLHSMTPSPQATEAMRLLESADPYQRQLGFLRLEALREQSSVGIIKRYIDSKDPDVRSYSIRALAAIDGENAIPILLEALRKDKHPRVRRAALLALEPFAKVGTEIIPALIKALRDHSTEVRMAAVDIVSRIDEPSAKEAIRLRLRREHRRDVIRVLSLAQKRLSK